MDKQKKQIIIISILLVPFILLWAKAFRVIKKKGGAKPKPQAVDLSARNLKSILTQPAKTEPLAEVHDDQKDEELRWLRCPFSGKAYSRGTGVEDLELNGILWDQEDPKAIINTKIVSLEDTIGKYTILGIEKDKVILTNGLQEFELKIGR
jgi:hypothetical protein